MSRGQAAQLLLFLIYHIVNEGDRIAQLILERVVTPEVVEVQVSSNYVCLTFSAHDAFRTLMRPYAAPGASVLLEVTEASKTNKGACIVGDLFVYIGSVIRLLSITMLSKSLFKCKCIRSARMLYRSHCRVQ